MKPQSLLPVIAFLAASCSSAPLANNGAPGPGPQVIYARTEPGTVELTRDFQPMHPAEVLADIKDPGVRIDNVMLQFVGIPLEVPMENVGGTTWRAQLTPRQLEMLSVSGRTIHYEARIVAHDEQGNVGKSKRPVEVAVKSPDLVGAGIGAG